LKYVVLYQSKTGNTKQLAERIFQEIKNGEKELIDIDLSATVPEADVYFIGFGVRSSFCSMDILDAIETIQSGAVAFFATCGCFPIEQYKYMIERKISLWLANEVNYLGMFLCQGKVEEYRKKILLEENSNYKKELEQMFERGNDHPDAEDLTAAAEFVQTIIARMNA